MNTERILELAKNDLIRDEYTEFGWQECHYYRFDPDELEKFAALVAAEEREACAKVCESLEIPDTIEGCHPDYVDGKRMAVMQCAAAIRARGN